MTRTLTFSFLLLASLAHAGIQNGEFDNTTGGKLDFWNPVNTTKGVDTGPPVNSFAALGGKANMLASISQTFVCDGLDADGPICEITFQYQFKGFANTDNLKITGVDGAWTNTDTINRRDNDWHVAKFRFDNPSCGNTLTLTFSSNFSVWIDKVTDQCAPPEAPAPAAGITALFMGVKVLRRRKRPA